MEHTPGEKVTDELRALIMADLAAGVKPASIKEQYGVSLPTITRIKQALSPDVLQKIDIDRQSCIADMIITHLETSLEGAVNIAMMTRDDVWMRSQTAGDLNKMYGTMSDKSLRMVEVVEFTRQAEAEDAQEIGSHNN